MDLRSGCDELLSKLKSLEEEIQIMERQIGDMRMLKDMREERVYLKEDIHETEGKVAYLKRYVGKQEVKIPGVAAKK